MKTVIDAVDWYRGNCFVTGEHEKHHTHLAKGKDGGVYSVYASDVGREDIICSIREYSELVTELSHTAGEYEFNQYLISDKTPLTKEVDYTSEEFWGDAPEWAVDVRIYTGKTEGYIYTNGYDTIQNIAQNIVEDISYPVLTVDKWKVIAIRPQPKPVYTQEMYDNGELPSVGMECIACYGIGGKQEEMVTIAHINEKGHFACIDSYGDYMIQYVKEDSDEHFKPIDTRTDEEKAIDDLANNSEIKSCLFTLLQDSFGYHRVNDDQQDHIESIISKIMEVLPTTMLRDIEKGKIHGITWSKGNE